MKRFVWDGAKNSWLKRVRGISFEEILEAITSGGILDIMEHPNRQKYRGQRIYVVSCRGYVCLVPYIEKGDEILLKTIIPSRKFFKKYRGRL